MKKASGLVKVCGRVKAWIDEDDCDMFMIVTPESGRIKVDPNRAGADLGDHEGEWVEATGVTRREDGSTHMVLHSFRVVNDECWEEDDDDEW